MRKFTSRKILSIYLPAILLILSASFFVFYKQTQKIKLNSENKIAEDPDAKGGFTEQQLVEEAFKLEFRKTRDPHTNTVPKYRLIEAMQYADRLKMNQAPGALGGLNWTERGPSDIGGRTRAILPDLNDASGKTVWAGSVAGGLWKTTNINLANPTWTPVDDHFDNLAVCAIAQNAQHPNIMYFGTGEGYYNGDYVLGDGIWKTTNGGNTWNQLPSTAVNPPDYTFDFSEKILSYNIGATEYLFSCTHFGVQRSKDGGVTWKEVLGAGIFGKATRAADIARSADGSLYASLGIFQTDGIYKSTDNGDTWTKLTKGLPASGYQRIQLACAPSDSTRVYALLQNSSNYTCLGIYRSDSAGRSWKAVTNPTIYGGGNFASSQAWYALTVGVDPNNADRIIVGGLDLVASKDGGITWTIISQWYGGGGYQDVHADQHAIVFDPRNSDKAYFGNDGGVFISTNATATIPTITSRDNSYNVTQFYHAAISPTPNNNYLIGGTQDNGNIRFTNAGMNPGYDFTGGDGAFVHIDDDQPNIQVAAYVYGNYHISTNNFASFINVSFGSVGLFINPTDYDSRDNTLYGSDNANRYHMILNVGTSNTKQTKTVSAFGGGQVSTVRISPNTRKRVFFGLDNGKIFMVDSANATTPIVTEIDHSALENGYNVSCIAVEPGNDNHLLVCFSNYGIKGNSVWETKNGGTTWTSIGGNLPDMPIRSVCFQPYSNTKAIIGTELGVWSTDNLNGSSTNWGESNTGLARVRTDWVDYRKAEGTLFAATHGRGVFTSTSFEQPVISFVKTDTTINKADNNASVTDCRRYKDISIPVQLSLDPSAAAQVHVSASGNKLVQGVDYDLLTTANLIFSSASVQNVAVRIYNTYNSSLSDTLNISLSLANGGSTNAIITPFPNFKIYAIIIQNSAPQLTLPVQLNIDTLTATQFIGPNRTVYFYDSTPAKHILASITNNANNSLACFHIGVDRAGNNANVPFNDSVAAHYLASKTFKVISLAPGSNLNYTITLYYSNAEITRWETESGKTISDLKIVAVKDHAVKDVTPATPYTSDVQIGVTTHTAYNGADYAFSANFTSVTNIEGFGLGAPSLTLPVTLTSFQGSLVNGNALLSWSTATEFNNKGFEVEKSLDGRTFQNVGFIAGSGTTTQTHNYNFTDNVIKASVNYYRLKQIDVDGKFTFSNIITLTKNDALNSVSVLENPFSSQLKLLFNGNVTGNALIVVYDINGKAVYKSSQNVQSMVTINAANFAKGTYMILVMWNDKKYNLKLIKK